MSNSIPLDFEISGCDEEYWEEEYKIERGYMESPFLTLEDLEIIARDRAEQEAH